MKKIRPYLIDAVFLFLGSAFYATALDLFILPANISIGGVTGISTILNYLFETPVGLMIIVINVPLVLVAWRIMGSGFIIRTGIGLALSSVFIDIYPNISISISDPLLSCLFGGAFIGIALGLIFMRGYTTGGSDIAIWIIRKKFPAISTGILYFIIDAVVVSAAAIIRGNPQGLLYSVITIFISTRTMDVILSSGDIAKMLIIVSDDYEKISERLTLSIGRGVTLLDGTGYFTGEPKKVILCVVSRTQAPMVRTIIKSIDRNAFIIMSDASQVIGEGFKPIDSDKQI